MRIIKNFHHILSLSKLILILILFLFPDIPSHSFSTNGNSDLFNSQLCNLQLHHQYSSYQEQYEHIRTLPNDYELESQESVLNKNEEIIDIEQDDEDGMEEGQTSTDALEDNNTNTNSNNNSNEGKLSAQKYNAHAKGEETKPLLKWKMGETHSNAAEQNWKMINEQMRSSEQMRSLKNFKQCNQMRMEREVRTGDVKGEGYGSNVETQEVLKRGFEGPINVQTDTIDYVDKERESIGNETDECSNTQHKTSTGPTIVGENGRKRNGLDLNCNREFQSNKMGRYQTLTREDFRKNENGAVEGETSERFLRTDMNENTSAVFANHPDGTERTFDRTPTSRKSFEIQTNANIVNRREFNRFYAVPSENKGVSSEKDNRTHNAKTDEDSNASLVNMDNFDKANQYETVRRNPSDFISNTSSNHEAIEEENVHNRRNVCDKLDSDDQENYNHRNYLPKLDISDERYAEGLGRDVLSNKNGIGSGKKVSNYYIEELLKRNSYSNFYAEDDLYLKKLFFFYYPPCALLLNNNICTCQLFSGK